MTRQLAIAAMAQRLSETREKAAVYADMDLGDLASRHAHHADVQLMALVRLARVPSKRDA